jgi:hypothetical protein
MNRKNRRGEFVQGILHAYVKVSHWNPCVQRICANKKKRKKLQFGQKSQYKIRGKKGIVSEEISSIKKKPWTLHWDNREDSLSFISGIGQTLPTSGSGYERVNSFEMLSLEKKAPLGHPAHTELPESCFPRIHFTMLSFAGTQRPNAAAVWGA